MLAVWIALALIAAAVVALAVLFFRFRTHVRHDMGHLKDVIAQINGETNTLAATVAALRDRLGSGEIATADDLSTLDAISARLTALAADPANPVPSEGAVPETPSAPPDVPPQP